MKQSDVCRGRTADIRKGTGIDMDQLKKANEYVKQNRIPKEELPMFHVTPAMRLDERSQWIFCLSGKDPFILPVSSLQYSMGTDALGTL